MQTQRDVELIRFWSRVGGVALTALAYLGACVAGVDHRELAWPPIQLPTPEHDTGEERR
ncbi:MAG TPA: hypothetical protein VJ914_38925 [Pseudonocardiaceae bacterium]|nr:hypothetical protein [Pseudonocardiaceae bacterium]